MPRHLNTNSLDNFVNARSAKAVCLCADTEKGKLMLQQSPLRLALIFCLGACLLVLRPVAAQQNPPTPPATKPAPQTKDPRADSKDKQKKPPNRADAKADQPTSRDDESTIRLDTDL